MLSRSCRIALVFLAVAGLASTPDHSVDAQGAGAKRIALVIGNSAYRNLTGLVNPLNDATDMAAKLARLKFEVLLATDADHARMTAVLEEFKAKVSRDHVALVFYAGHGVTVNRESFLLPVDTPDTIELDDAGQMRGEVANRVLIGMASVLAPLEAARLGIVFLDACRSSAADTGLGMKLRLMSLGQTRSVPVIRGTGSTEIRPSPYSAGVFRAYATQLDNVASDGSGRNSPFTKALLEHIATRGITIQELMIRVRRSVMQETDNQQIPWEEAALNESFSFVPEPAAPTRPTSARQPAQPTQVTAPPPTRPVARPAARKSGGTPNVAVGTGF